MCKYDEELRKQLRNSDNPGINEFLKELYSLVSTEIRHSGKTLEIGAGAGISSKFLTEMSVLRTDLFSFPESDVRGNIDSHELPFADNSFDASIAIDVLHHLERPLKSLLELKRITNFETGGRIVLVEPYVSWLSYPIYRAFHSERTSFPLGNRYSEPFKSRIPEDGDQSLSRLLFTNRDGKALVSDIFPPELYSIKIYIFSVFSFFMTGGLSKPLPMSRKFVKLMFLFESTIPQLILRILGARCMIVIKEKS